MYKYTTGWLWISGRSFWESAVACISVQPLWKHHSPANQILAPRWQADIVITIKGHKTVLIIGGNTGLSFETVKALYESGATYTIIHISRSLEKFHAAATQLKEAQKDIRRTIDTFQLDITSDESVRAAFDYVQQKYGKLDTLINNAG